jgi:cysteine desulfurase
MIKKNLYFDIAATTPLNSEVTSHMNEINQTIFGNPSSIHQIGQKAHNIIERARKKIANLLHCKESEIYFTSGGSESNNIALRGVLNKGDHLITSSYEHPAILEVAKYLENNEIEVSYVNPDEDGIVKAKAVNKAIKQNTKLISIMFANNELGSTNPIEEIGQLCADKNIYLHSDAVQCIGKKNIRLSESTINILSIGAHKFYGPKGIGAIYIQNGTIINPLIIGGGQEKGISPGTENPSLISGMATALEIAMNNLEKNNLKIEKMEKLFTSLLDQTDIRYSINGSKRLQGFINITFFDYDGYSLLLNLDMNNIAISYGSACSSGSAKASNALLVTGMKEEIAKNTVRISIGNFIEEDDIKQLVNTLKKIITK